MNFLERISRLCRRKGSRQKEKKDNQEKAAFMKSILDALFESLDAQDATEVAVNVLICTLKNQSESGDFEDADIDMDDFTINITRKSTRQWITKKKASARP